MEVPDGHFSLPMAMMLARSNVVSEAHEMDERIRPFPEQYAMGPGCYGIVASSRSMVEQDFTLLKLLDPEEHKDAFPNWEERLQRSYVLCEWLSNDDPEGDIGWFSRVKLVEITEEQYAEVKTWIREDALPDEPPDWLDEAYALYTERLSKMAPDDVTVNVLCGECGSRKVEIHIYHAIRKAAPAGQVEKDGKTVFLPMGHRGSSDCVAQIHLHCQDCNARRDLDDDEIGFDAH